MTDHERLIICFTNKPFPIWIWTPDDATKEEMEKAYQIAAEHSHEQGNHVASCKFAPNGNLASINLVFTRPEYRRKHYAENLVYQVSKLAMEAGYVPMLYTDADYIASNACYEKIGYVLRGKLCTIS